MYRKISKAIEDYLKTDDGRILCVTGARQVGKTHIIKELAPRYYKNYIELNMVDDKNGPKLFQDVNTLDSFYLKVSSIAGDKMDSYDNTIIFIDEIQEYEQLLTLLKPLNIDHKYRIICSGSELGMALKKTTSIPIGSLTEIRMYPMDFEEFLLANSVGSSVIDYMRNSYLSLQPIDSSLHDKIMELFKQYLLIGGMPQAVKEYLVSKNISKVRSIHNDIIKYYSEGASKYDKAQKLKIKRIYEMITSTIDSKVRRLKYSQIDNIKGARYTGYIDEFDYLISSGIALETKAISEPRYPLIQSSEKNLIKLYMNDIGLLTAKLYKNNITAVLNDMSNVNLGAVYETVTAQELKCHGHDLYYYDNKKNGEVDYLIEDNDNLSVLPIEIKSGRDYTNYRALPKIISNQNYPIQKGYVFNNTREVIVKDKIIHLPIYYIMFL